MEENINLNLDNLNKELNELKDDTSKLLYLINYLFKVKMIDYLQKKILKQQVINNDSSIYSLLATYNANKNLDEFLTQLKSIYDQEMTNDHSKSTIHKALMSSLSQHQMNKGTPFPPDINK